MNTITLPPGRVPFQLPVQSNPLQTRDDLQQAFAQLTQPLHDYYSPGGALLQLDNTGQHYEPRGCWMEAFSRVLWGLVPLLAGGGNDTRLLERYLAGLTNGSDPSHPEYWGGDVAFADQRMVEMAAIGLALALTPQYLWQPLSESAKDNLCRFLTQILDADPAPSNWLFFRVLVCLGLKQVGRPYRPDLLAKTLDQLDSFYLGDGWYSDGKGGRCDYYNPFAMHFYGLLYATVMQQAEPERCNRYRERAALFARDFVHWFDDDGRAIPYGRSMTYRFAQSAFWSAASYAGEELLPWGEMKGLVLRNLRWWLQQPILSRDGILSIGYAYPNLIFSEEYNGPGGPYWALKTLLVLALPESHPFWQAEELPLPKSAPTVVQSKPGMIIQSLPGHKVALCSGQAIPVGFSNFDARYSKFAYSSAFGFSVSRGSKDLRQGAFDSMLAVAPKDDPLWRVRSAHTLTKISDNKLCSRWSPLPGVEIETQLIAANPWHLRIHTITTNQPLLTAEGGFAIGRNRTKDEGELLITDDRAVATLPWGVSGIVNLQGQRKATLVQAEANTNAMANRTLIPTLEGELPPGTHRLVAAVYAGNNPIGYSKNNPSRKNWKSGNDSISAREKARLICNRTGTWVLSS